MNVSVIIAAYNAELTLAETLESVLAQTHIQWEVVVVDDGSTDRTSQIANSYSQNDPRIRVVSQANGGEAAARNTGIDHSQYDWLLFLDSDDWIAPTHLQKMTAALDGRPELDGVLCGFVRVDLRGTRLAAAEWPPAGDLFPVLARQAAFAVHSCIVRKSVVLEVGKFDTSLDKSPDWDLWQRIARTGAQFGRVKEVLAFYRVRPTSSSLSAEALFRDGLTVLKRGHTRDPRVARPLPEYADGAPGSTVESQVFYLLCWSAGLMLGHVRDPRRLLEMVREYRYPSLSPEAIARCIFESGTMPSSHPREAWDALLPRVAGMAEQFLEELEEQSQTPGLAAAALHNLKLAVLRRSPLWGPVVERETAGKAENEALVQSLYEDQKQRIAYAENLEARIRALYQDQKERIAYGESLEARIRDLQEDQKQRIAQVAKRDSANRDLHEDQKQRIAYAENLEARIRKLDEDLKQRMEQAAAARAEQEQRQAELTALSDALEETRRALDELLQQPNRAMATGEQEAVAYRFVKPPADFAWRLETSGYAQADLLAAEAGAPAFRVEIAKPGIAANWEIQANIGGFRLDREQHYRLRWRARADSLRSVCIGVALAREPWTNLGCYEVVWLAPEWHEFQSDFQATGSAEDARIHLDLGGRRVAVEIADVQLERVEAPAAMESSSSAEQPA